MKFRQYLYIRGNIYCYQAIFAKFTIEMSTGNGNDDGDDVPKPQYYYTYHQAPEVLIIPAGSTFFNKIL